MSDIHGFYADSRRVQQGNGYLSVTIPAKIVEEFEIEAGDDLPQMAEEGAGELTVLRPKRSDETASAVRGRLVENR